MGSSGFFETVHQRSGFRVFKGFAVQPREGSIRVLIKYGINWFLFNLSSPFCGSFNLWSSNDVLYQ